MKKICILLVFCALLFGCDNTPYAPANGGGTWAEKTFDVGTSASHEENTLKIDGCQYLLYGSFHSRVLTRKGNCNNSIHMYRVSKVKND